MSERLDSSPTTTEATAASDTARRNIMPGFRRRFTRSTEPSALHGEIPTRRPARAGNTLPVYTLAPEFRPEHHQVYVDLLERSLRHKETRSVALTGAYGSGKSSVLRALRGRWWKRWKRRVVVELSLSTLDPAIAPEVSPENPAERDVSNRIQKEIVKQLLYRLPPRRTPHSRFPRASRPSWSGGLLAAMAAGAAVGLLWIAATFAGWQTQLDARLAQLGWSPASFWTGVIVGTVLLALLTWWTVSGRYAVRAGVKTGALTVSLEPTSSSYFDQYLDEIMYFFQVSKTNLVLIEDVDRFSDASVLDTLRALNHLINNSRQVGRRVVFIYAIRDSVLGQLGAGYSEEDDARNARDVEEDASLEIDRANRAKYFDVIIPIVPFVTSANARDLMVHVMGSHVAETSSGEGISPALIRLVARHVADMRTLRSVRNEYEVHADRLIAPSNAMPEISADIVFALVLLRATSPLTFENIRLSSSSLDDLVERWLLLVDANLAAQTKKLTQLRTQIQNAESRTNRADTAGGSLDAIRSELLTMARSITAETVRFDGPLEEGSLGDPEAWQRIADGEALRATLRSKQDRMGRTSAEPLALGAPILSRLLGMQIEPNAWKTADLADLKTELAKTENEIAFLRHHTWKELYDRADLKVTLADGDYSLPSDESSDERPTVDVSFVDLVEHFAPTPLSRELIEHGYLPRHFARYSSMFYGHVVGLNATEYISRAIEPGIPVIEYELDDDAVLQILTEQQALRDDADLFDDPSVYNLDLVAYLLKHRPQAAARVARQLAGKWGELEQRFVSRFFQREAHAAAEQLAALMTPTWGQALRYTAVEADVTPATRSRLVDAAMTAISTSDRADLDGDVGRYLADNYAELPIVSNPPSLARARLVMSVVKASGASIDRLEDLNRLALAAASELSVYPMTGANLQALRNVGDVALDVLSAERVAVYNHALHNLPAYLGALPRISPASAPIRNCSAFVTVLNDVAGAATAATLTSFVNATPLECRIDALDEVGSESWPVLIESRRTDPTFDNVQRYVAARGVDQVLGDFLSHHGHIVTPESAAVADRLALVQPLLAARAFIPTGTRVELAISVSPGEIPVGSIEPQDGALIGPLLAAGLLSDESATFSPHLLGKWADLEAAIAASANFAQFADPSVLPPRHLASAISSSRIPDVVKSTLVEDLEHLLVGATSADATAVADALASVSAELDVPRIDALRTAGASSGSLMRALAQQDGVLSVADLRAVLAGMSGHYERVARGGAGTVRFDVNEAHRAVLARLEGVTHTGAKVNTTKLYGTKLEASLKQPTV